MPSEPSILREMLGDTPPAAFFEQHYLKLPLARSVEQPSWTHLADWNAIDRLLRHPEADAMIGRQGEQWPSGTPWPEQRRDILAQGYTIGLRHVDRYDAEFARLADQFRSAFNAPIDVHLYCTPANQPGFGWHYDAEEVFVLQAHGGKDWWLRKNTVNPWPLIDNIPANQQYERELMPAMHCRLEAGDWLYIPGGYWHRTQAETESISLSVGIRAWTALDVFDALRLVLADSLMWRQRLPRLANAGITEDEVSAHWKEIWAALGDDLARQFQDDAVRRGVLHHFQSLLANNVGHVSNVPEAH